MAKIIEGKWVIQLSKLVKNDNQEEIVLTDEELETIQSAVEQLVDDETIVVEIIA